MDRCAGLEDSVRAMTAKFTKVIVDQVARLDIVTKKVYSYGLYSYGLSSCGLYSYGRPDRKARHRHKEGWSCQTKPSLANPCKPRC